MSADMGAREPLAQVLERALQDRFDVGKVTRWLELAIEVNAGNADLFPNELAALAAGVGVPPDKDLVGAPAKERQDARGDKEA